MKIGDKVYGEDGSREFTGWIAIIDDNRSYPYTIVRDRKDIGLTRMELNDLYEFDREFNFFELEHLTLLEDEPCQYCNLTKRELEIVQSELNDVYAMLQNRDDKIKELERELNH